MNVPSVADRQLRFGLPDPERRYVSVSLDCDDAISGRRRFRRTSTGWALSMQPPDVVRLEYRLIVTARDGSVEVVCDPTNAERVSTAFGERSVVRLPGYAPPAWLDSDPPAGSVTELEHDDPRIGTLPMTIWSPSRLASADPAPLLVVHDGPEYVKLAGLATYAAAMVEARTLPPFRLALMQPVERDEWYAANNDYIRAELGALETIGASVAVSGLSVSMGASLGGLTALLLALAGPTQFAGVLAQSGSFFRADLDAQEEGYPSFQRVVQAVRDIDDAEPTGRRLQVAMTCGVLEENHANNLQMVAALRRGGHDVRFLDVRDLHNYTAWRDSLDPALTDLLRSVWGTQG